LAAIVAALIVSVAFVPGVTDAGETPQVGIGEGPLTEHVNAIFPEKPVCSEKLNTSLACPPRLTERLVVAGLTEKSGKALNMAVTDWFEFSVTLQPFGSAPMHAPLQLEKVELAEGTALSTTAVPLNNVAEQVVPQSMVESD
jgi:hypothetical protein